ncbi:reverse transcriptase domain-containing protein [Tanacetum coccineum]
MRTRNSYFPNNSNVTIPRRRNKGRAPNIVEPELRTIVAPMAERTMEELLRAPTEGYGEAIVLPEINADHFEIKTNLLQLVQANPFYGRESENPHAHINSFKRITSTLRFRNVPNDETFSEAWERFKELLRACPHHGFTELTQVDTFYNGLNENEQDSLNAAAGSEESREPTAKRQSRITPCLKSTFLVTPLSNSNKDEYFDPGGDNDEIDAFLAIEVPTYIEEGYYDSEGDVIYLESLLRGGEINVEVDDSFTFVTRTFLPYPTYPEVSPLLSSTKNEDTIFDPDIST